MDGSGSGTDAIAGDLVGDYLEHFGVKGMKWGVRRNRDHSAPEGSSHDAQNAFQVRETIKRTGGTHTLSNKELQSYITRANLEQQYARLSAQDPAFQKGHNFLKKAVGFGQTLNNAYNLYNSPLAKEIRKQFEKTSSKSKKHKPSHLPVRVIPGQVVRN